MNIADILQRIIDHKAHEIADRAQQQPLSMLAERAVDAGPVRGFSAALQRRIKKGDAAVIAEIKKASPSKGVLRENFDPAAIAKAYENGGAAALSVLTDSHFFQGAEEHLVAARAACGLPVLRKEFLIDAYQVYESRVIGADCILLIVAALNDIRLNELANLGLQLGLDVLVEVHTIEELQRTTQLHGVILGINNRDLHTFQTSLHTTLKLLDQVPKNTIVVTESGIRTAADVIWMRDHGVCAFLVGEAFMRMIDPGTGIYQLFGNIKHSPV